MNIQLRHLGAMALAALIAGSVLPAEAQISAGGVSITPTAQKCIAADVVALDQVYFWNRLGAYEPQGQMFALRRDVISTGLTRELRPGQVALRSDKRPRPLVLRVNVGQCLTIKFENLLAFTRSSSQQKQPATRTASIHVAGMQLRTGIMDDGSYVGTNPNSMVAPGQSTTYSVYAEREGTYLLHSNGALFTGEGEGGTISTGLFGAVNVEPAGSEWYRSQVTEEELRWATKPRLLASLLVPNPPPSIDYDAVYPQGHSFAGKPIFNMLYKGGIFHSDLTAIITGPDKGWHSPGTYPAVKVYRDRHEPFREFTIIFHDEIGAKQAFPEFFDSGGSVVGPGGTLLSSSLRDAYSHALHSVRDAFAINYGTGGIGAEIFANRLGVGPMWDCTNCRYEEFFLSAWAVGDPAMVVDIPANAKNSSGNLIVGPKATKAFYPDDPSNVYHSYMSDHVKFRNLLAGTDDHHIFHLHAHQWLHTPDADHSSYLDSQAIGQGTGFTYEIAYDGSGNRNKTVGDSIFHCHFYPHFAQGMWAMWRVHDVFEEGTPLDQNGRPLAGSRAYPDGEIAKGTPIPGLVPLPGKPMAPMPGAQVSIVNGQVQLPATGGNPGYPFFVPGVAGERVPTPPLDMIDDGGLPRHVVLSGQTTEAHTPYDFHKHMLVADAVEVPASGTYWEKVAMKAHAQTDVNTCLPNGGCGSSFKFLYNGHEPQMGSPYADPCFYDSGAPVPDSEFKRYRAANLQMDVKFNKEGWHFGQQRFISLWDDVNAFLNGGKPPEPFFFRANTGHCVVFEHTNLVPAEYAMDDFQVRTPTDVLGQHIHLVKFDVTSSDGSANGWNYEDGNMSPEEVRAMVAAINLGNGGQGLFDPATNSYKQLTAKPHFYLGSGPNGDWVGAQTSVQRWYVDDTLSMTNKDRTLRTVFTHDHFGPSTHQQSGLYAGLVVERKGALWRDPDTGAIFGPTSTRYDGGPTSWRADILQTQFDDCENPTGDGANKDDFCRKEAFREFLLEFGDFQQAYKEGHQGPDHDNAINPPICEVEGNTIPSPCPEAVSAADSGTMLVNYRNEPIGLRVQQYGTTSQASGQAGDLSFAFSSQVNRSNPKLNQLMTGYNNQLTPDVLPRDPATPLLPAVEGDAVQIRVLVGAHEEEHNFSVAGVRWPAEPSLVDSGYRASQMMGISEHFEFEIPILPQGFEGETADFLYKAGSSVDDLWNGIWGIMRVYSKQVALVGTDGPRLLPGNSASNPVIQGWSGACPVSAKRRKFEILAVAAKDALPGGTLFYNARNGYNGPISDDNAIMFVRKSDYDFVTGKIKSNINHEPLIIRAIEGECIQVDLTNLLNTPLNHTQNGASKLPDIVHEMNGSIRQIFNQNSLRPSAEVGLHPQLVYYDVTKSDGLNVGLNPKQTASPGQTHSYEWYAGEVSYSNGNGAYKGKAVEYGSTGLASSDPILHTNKGAVGAMIIEPKGASWTEDWVPLPAPTPFDVTDYKKTYASATVFAPGVGEFREFVLVFQTDLSLQYQSSNAPIPNMGVANNSAESGQNALNYRTEPVWHRLGYAPETDPGVSVHRTDLDITFANSTVGGDPVTPVFTASAGEQVRFRMINPGGHGQQNTFGIHGHIWQEYPYTNASRSIGSNPLSEWKGSQHGHGPTNHFDIVLENGAGGKYKVTGDFMYRDYVSWYLASGLWGILRVLP